MSEWSVDTLKEHVDVRFEAVREAIKVASDVTKERADKLESATQSRFESVNEFRNQTKDLQSNFMPRAEFDSSLSSLKNEMNSMKKSLTEKIEAKNVQIVASLSVGMIGMMIAVFNLATRLAG